MPALRRPKPRIKLKPLPKYGNPKGSREEREAWMRARQRDKAAAQ